MASLSREYRKLLENTVVSARQSAVSGARKALTALRVGDKEAPTDPDQKALRNQLRAHGRQLGDVRQPDGTQETRRLEQACAYEHWHRLLFARFLAENGLLVNPDYGVAMSLAEIQETAREQNHDWLSMASDYAQRMLLEVFRPSDPVLHLTMPPETRQELEELLAQLPAAVFAADDSLGWVYQYWQRDEKERVNKSETKIGADELSPVTQLFTEDYMVLFLLHNTLGAWWTAKRRAEGKNHQLPGYEWTYLRLNEDGSPTAGSFDGWPRTARELRILDPCMGSGHFLTFALPILALMREEEEGLSVSEAVHAALAANLFGLELDARCSQIAAFNLALTAWRTVGRPMPLPSLNLACSGLGIHATEESWLGLAGENRNVRFTLAQSYKLFQKAPTLGSLIDPTRDRRAFIEFDQVWPLLEVALSAEQQNDESRELAIAAKGVLAAARMLSKRFTLVSTNVPYLGRGKHSSDLADYCQDFHGDAKADLATCFVDRCLRFCSPGGSVALVTPQNWLFLTSYKKLRERLLKEAEWNFVVRLGEHAFESSAAAGAFAALLSLTQCTPSEDHSFPGWKLEDRPTVDGKAGALRKEAAGAVGQLAQFNNPDAAIALEMIDSTRLLGHYADCFQGTSTGDSERLVLCFWEVDCSQRWRPFQGPPNGTDLYRGREFVVDWPVLERGFESAAVRGQEAWGRMGIGIGQLRSLPATLYTGDLFSNSTPVIIPREKALLAPVWAFCSSLDFAEGLRKQNPKLSVDNGYVGKIPFDLARWQAVASAHYPQGLPDPSSSDPTQWLFSGDPCGSSHPIQVAVARLVGYRWPRQSVGFSDVEALTEDGLAGHSDPDGVVCLASVSGEAPAADRLRALLADAYGAEWSAAKLAELLGNCSSLELWLRDRFFEEHCQIFHQRPFVWHIWDGRKDGFHALVNYHKLAGPNGEGRRTLEKLIYTALGDWIKRQRDEVAKSQDGAEGRLAAALHLHSQLENILEGEGDPDQATGYDIFVRWKPLYEQPMGWEPDLNDGIRLNMRPWLHSRPYQEANQKLKQGACVLRVTPIKLPLGKDRGKEPLRNKEDFPWFASNQDRTNDKHFTLEQKRAAKERKKKA